MSWGYLSGILILTGINLMTVLGLSLLTGFTGLFSFGHAGFMAIGAYTAAMFTLKFNILPESMFQLQFYLALIAGGLVAMIFSLIIGKLTLNLKGDYFCIATLGFGEAIRLILDNVDYFGGARGLSSITTQGTTTLTNVVIINIIAITVLVFIIKSRHGRNMVAIREEELAAQTIGIDVFKYKMISFAISAFYAGIAGGLMAHYFGYIQPIMFKLVKSTELTIIVIFGGLGSVSGSVVGTILLTFLPELLRSFANWRLVLYGAAVIIIMISRPQGLMGGKEFSIKGLVRFIAKRRKEGVKS
ncbi:MAG: branched-chain amino acid ABC transporter permease [Tissierellia bacterium]|jgi:branched-chain amino acid transport system permease protein|nr:branched-chain amino acid ABC transporter permease [Sedimentibacter sp.]NLA13139.1 branched-chain amino acid ABC transporter permease [Tissierellia bacterium]HOA20110.1 branched-chain amino acid ABC transporter permease [Sedimentibacter sp.]HOG63260.1 branched-chain amino acid ABC transporter permease [Sedimentibacter sp.]HPY55999.1 branched-chain amino acid ABC transporter permease [Sedimentibacter sp.]